MTTRSDESCYKDCDNKKKSVNFVAKKASRLNFLRKNECKFIFLFQVNIYKYQKKP